MEMYVFIRLYHFFLLVSIHTLTLHLPVCCVVLDIVTVAFYLYWKRQPETVMTQGQSFAVYMWMMKMFYNRKWFWLYLPTSFQKANMNVCACKDRYCIILLHTVINMSVNTVYNYLQYHDHHTNHMGELKSTFLLENLWISFIINPWQ